jgi:invasion protein IalB
LYWFARLLALTLAATSSPLAQQTVASTSVFDGWTLKCETVTEKDRSTKACEVDATATAKTEDNRQALIMIVGIGKRSAGQPTQIAVQTPLTAWLPLGVKLQDGNGKDILSLPYTACQPSRCTAEGPITDSQLTALTSAGDVFVAIYRTQAGEDIKVQIPVKGLSAAYKAMMANFAGK